MNTPANLESRFARELALRRQGPFDQLSAAELSLVAAVAEVSAHAPGALIQAPESTVSHLLVVVRGSVVTADGQSAGRMVGLGALLADRRPRELRAGPEGCELIGLSKGFLHTLIRECPAFAQGLVTLPPEAGLR